MSPEKQLKNLLKSSGSILVRCNKHEVWRVPGGHTLVLSATASDKRAIQNKLTDLKRMLKRPTV